MTDETTAQVRFGGPATDRNTRAALQGSTPQGPEADGPWTVHGILLGPDELTVGQHGPKYWPADEQEKAVASLKGKQFSVLHEDEAVGHGTITASGFDDTQGTAFEAEIDDWETAAALGNGKYDVSLEAGVDSQEQVGHTSDGVPYLKDYEFKRIAAVAGGTGASNANYTALGPAANNPAIAALSEADDDSFHSAIDAALAQSEASTGMPMSDVDHRTEATITVSLGNFPNDAEMLASLAENESIGYQALLEAADIISPENVNITAEEERADYRVF